MDNLHQIEQRAHYLANNPKLDKMLWEVKYNLLYASLEIEWNQTDEELIEWLLSDG